MFCDRLPGYGYEQRVTVQAPSSDKAKTTPPPRPILKPNPNSDAIRQKNWEETHRPIRQAINTK